MRDIEMERDRAVCNICTWGGALPSVHSLKCVCVCVVAINRVNLEGCESSILANLSVSMAVELKLTRSEKNDDHLLSSFVCKRHTQECDKFGEDTLLKTPEPSI